LNDLDLPLLLESNPGLISFLPQEIRLVSESIVSNVAFGVQTKDLNIARIEDCLKHAGIWNYLTSANISLTSKLDNSGSFLSGGQRQRLALARALYCNSRIIILDEPTSSLDSKSTKDLLEVLSLISSRVLVVVVSHDDSLLNYTDSLIRIAKDGTVLFPNT
jgi:ABC-type bacteriocin/lantibiotic exporter with double-glycine peptidase domain